MSTETKWQEMEPRERDAAVGENVMGLLRVKMSRSWRDPEDGSEQIHVEDEDDGPKMECFGNALCPSHIPAEYMPHGDNRDAYREPVPHYTTDAAADYLVLQRVRETWTGEPVEKFCDVLFWIIQHEDRQKKHGSTLMDPDWVSRSSWIAWYEPGDYSRAAYLALTD